jgi:hypothetical protein
MKGFLFLPFAFLAPGLLQAQSFSWAKQLSNVTSVHSICTDLQGNVLLGGTFEGGMDCDPGPGIFNITSGLNIYGTFLVKLNSAGSFIWGKNAGLAFGGSGGAMTMDPAGNSYIAGGLTINVNKSDTAGNTIWAHTIAGATVNDNGEISAISYDPAGFILLTGIFYGTIDFDPGPGTFNMSCQLGGTPNMFILKLDTAGNFVWARQLTGQTTAVRARGITVDAFGNVYSTGQFNDTVDFDPGPATYQLAGSSPSNGALDMYISSLDNAGNFRWATRVGTTADDGGNAIVINSAGMLYIPGFRFSPVAPYNWMLIVKADTMGNIVWNKTIAGIGGAAVAIGVQDDLFLAGGFKGTIDFDPGTSVANMQSTGDGSVFILQLDSAGNYKTVKQSTGIDSSSAFATALHIDPAGSIFSSGLFTRTVDFNPGPAVYNMSTTLLFPGWYATDLFVQKWNPWSSSVPGISLKNGISIYPNPVRDIVSISTIINELGTVEVYDALGKKVLSTYCSSPKVSIKMTHLSAGVYFFRTAAAYYKVIKN